MTTWRRCAFWLAVSCSVGWHLRSALAWYCERSGETSGAPNLPLFKITTGRLHP